MKTYHVFEHPTRGLEAVKVGVSWPGFFFGFFWMLVKKMCRHRRSENPGWSFSSIRAGNAVRILRIQRLRICCTHDFLVIYPQLPV